MRKCEGVSLGLKVTTWSQQGPEITLYNSRIRKQANGLEFGIQGVVFRSKPGAQTKAPL